MCLEDQFVECSFLQNSVSSGKRNRGLILPRIDTGRNDHVSLRRSRSSGPVAVPAHGRGASAAPVSTTSGFDPKSGPLTLELQHGSSRQTVQLPTETLDRNKKYYVTFTINQVGNETADVI